MAPASACRASRPRLRGCRIVDGTGEVVVIDRSTPDLLAAAQVAIGMLGVMTEVEIEVVPRYRLAQRIEWWSFARLLDEWDERVARHRHFSCFWCPAPESAAHVRPGAGRAATPRRTWRG